MVEPRLLLQDLNRIGVHFIVGESYPESDKPLSPAELMVGLITQSDARLRLSIIAVLLQYPDYAGKAGDALNMLDESLHPIFMVYYTAACYLQKIYASQLKGFIEQFITLPDFYSKILHIPATEPIEEQLKILAIRHQEITGLKLNWHGTYHHAAQRLIRHFKVERSWNMA